MSNHLDQLQRLQIIERQIDSDGLIEDSYRPFSLMGNSLYYQLVQSVGFNIDELHELDLISLHKADHIRYFEDTVCLVNIEKPNYSLCDQYKLNQDRLLDFFACSIGLSTKTISYKFYYQYTQADLDFMNQFDSVFNDYWPALEFGVSYNPNNVKYKDYYFYTTDIEKVYKHFGFSEPEESKQWHDVNIAHFAILVDAFKNTIIKLKRYVHPSIDPKLSDWTSIAGKETCKKQYENTRFKSRLPL